MCSFAYKYIQDIDTCQEIVHDVFVKLWEKREQIDLSKSVKSYLFTAVSNKCKNHIRDNKKFVTNELATENTNYNDQDALKQLQYQELEEKIQEAINSLPEKCKEVFELNRYEGLKYKEIAEKLHISVKTVENQMGKALKVLREKLKNYVELFLFILTWFITRI